MLMRRKPSKTGTTARVEDDIPIFISGIENNYSTGSKIIIKFENKNIRSKDYYKFKNIPRPGHVDFVALKKFGKDYNLSGGGIFSGRMTVAIVAAGVLAMKLIPSIKFSAKILTVGGCNDIENTVKKVVAKGDSVGGIVECIISNVPIGLGEPFFYSIESHISHLAFSIPGIKGIEFGSGFASTAMLGSKHNDSIINISGKTETNHSGGINGGISNGNDIIFRVAVKPPSSISKTQKTINLQTKKIEDLTIKGRHDACIALRLPPIIEALAAIALADFWLEKGHSDLPV